MTFLPLSVKETTKPQIITEFSTNLPEGVIQRECFICTLVEANDLP